MATTCDWTLLEELWSALGSWTDGDINGAVSSISPAGQLYLDCRAMTDPGVAARNKDIGTIGTGDYTVYIRFKGDVWDKQSPGNFGITLYICGNTNNLHINIGHDNGDKGVFVRSAAGWVKVVTKTWDNDWHTIRLDVHNSQTDVDIYVDDEESPSATDAACDQAAIDDDGAVFVIGQGSVAGNGEYHIDFIKINSGLCDPTESGGPAGVKTINELAIASVKTINETAIASVKTINNSAV